VPGAGFRKAMAQKQTAATDRKFSQELVLAYGSMMDSGDLKFFNPRKQKMKLSDFARMIGLAQSAGIELEDLDEGAIQSGTMVPVQSTQMQTATSPDALKLAEERKQLAAERLELDAMRFGVEADQYIAPMVRDAKILGPDAEALKLLYVQAALDDKVHPITLGDQKLSRVEALKLTNAGRQKHILTLPDQVTDKPVLADGQRILPSQEDPQTGDDGPMSPERKKELLEASPHGQYVLNGQAK
jgi:hypothetical protein